VIRNLSSLGDSEAFSVLGDIFAQGTLESRDLDRAADYYRESMSRAAQGSSFYEYSKKMLELIAEQKNRERPPPAKSG